VPNETFSGMSTPSPVMSNSRTFRASSVKICRHAAISLSSISGSFTDMNVAR
jgi:hypothetical protein